MAPIGKQIDCKDLRTAAPVRTVHYNFALQGVRRDHRMTLVMRQIRHSRGGLNR
jgi:hypothetical protein